MRTHEHGVEKGSRKNHCLESMTSTPTPPPTPHHPLGLIGLYCEGREKGYRPNVHPCRVLTRDWLLCTIEEPPKVLSTDTRFFSVPSLSRRRWEKRPTFNSTPSPVDLHVLGREWVFFWRVLLRPRGALRLPFCLSWVTWPTVSWWLGGWDLDRK